MYNIVKIGAQEVPMLSMASVDLYYKQIFHEDPLTAQTELTGGGLVGFFERMAFVMAKFAETKNRKEMLKLTEDNFLEWLDGFDRAELIDALEAIQATYDGQQLTTTEAKKKDEEPSAE